MSDPARDLAVATELANAAGEIVRRHFRQLEHIEPRRPTGRGSSTPSTAP
ncbi:MAG TPA: hypothetical protein VKR24_08340 [Candidatus Limnocylindrales bacterium]|nr:hypothetical protein [Candidatus Limnocylindrales bacterium]